MNKGYFVQWHWTKKSHAKQNETLKQQNIAQQSDTIHEEILPSDEIEIEILANTDDSDLNQTASDTEKSLKKNLKKKSAA